MPDLEQRLEELRELGLHRRLRLVETAQGERVTLDGRSVLLLCSNDYLGLAGHPEVRAAAAEAAVAWGAGAGASRLVSGNMTVHAELEQRLAAFKGTESALLVGSGYLANVGVIAALAREDEVVFSDQLNHASIVDGCRLSRAETFVYRHKDVEHLEWGLRQAGRRAALIVTDGVFSMDGDVAPLAEILSLARRHGARLAVDEAHGTGTIGPGGRGAVVAAGLEGEVDVIVGTLGKALGSYGAFVACNARTADYLVNTMRPLIFSTALPPSVCAAATAALGILESEPELPRRLQANAGLLRAELAARGVATGPSETQIIPLLVGGADATMRACAQALERGVFAQGIRPPTVAPGTSRLRSTVMATHSQADLRTAAEGLPAAVRAESLSGSPTASPVATG